MSWKVLWCLEAPVDFSGVCTELLSSELSIGGGGGGGGGSIKYFILKVLGFT